MEKDFVNYDIALEMKQLGFDEPCLRVGNPNGHTMWKWIEVDKDNETISVNDILNVEYMEGYIQIPTFSQCFHFFREKYNLVHEISWSKYKGGVSFDYDIFSLVLPTDDELGDEDDIYIERPMETYDSLAGKTFRDMEFDSFEGAELAAIVKLIEIVKRKK
jgi:hypothetical protein